MNRSVQTVRDHLTSVSAVDAYLAPLISELWLPNLSAQTRQALALLVFASLEASAFSEVRLTTFAKFNEVRRRLARAAAHVSHDG